MIVHGRPSFLRLASFWVTSACVHGFGANYATKRIPTCPGFTKVVARERQRTRFLSIYKKPDVRVNSGIDATSSSTLENELGPARPPNFSSTVSNVLVCGDGDLSYSAWLAPQLAKCGISLTATVLEDKQSHHDVYKNSEKHYDRIASFEGHNTGFGVDATQLASYFPSGTTFDLIIFNFPHWRGKANNKKNRELLNAFLCSASQVLASKNGEVQVALCQGQGGSTARTAEEWRRSWMVALYAAEHGLLLQDVVSYKPVYDLSSHRGVDRPFRVGTAPKLYKFSFPSVGRCVEESLQLCCRHELHIMLPTADVLGSFTVQGLTEGDEILHFVETLVPDGIRVEIPIRSNITVEELNGGPDTMIFLIVYCGQQIPLTRANADMYRDRLETELSKFIKLRANRMGRLVSRPFPYPLLQYFIDELIKD